MFYSHVLLNVLDLHAFGNQARIVFEGSATRLVSILAQQEHPFHKMYEDAKIKGLIAGACWACSAKMKVTEAVEKEGLILLDDMNGHPSIHRFLEEGFTVITF